MGKTWRIGIVDDSANFILGHHGLQVAFLGLPRVEMAALVESKAEKLAEKMAQTGAKRHYATLGEMLESETLDIVILCSRHPYEHLEQIRMVAAKGCHVYCEKPMTADVEEADEIVGVAEAADIKICLAHPSRYSLAFRTMKRMVEDGEIGEPLAIYGRGKSDHRGGGEDLIVLGTHVLDLETFFFGAPECVMADVTLNGRPITKSDVNTETVEPIGPAAGDRVFAMFRFADGVRGTFESVRGLPGFDAGVVHMGIAVTGTRGTISMRFDDSSMPPSTLHISRIPNPPEDKTAWEEVALEETRAIPGAEPLDYSLRGQPGVPHAALFIESGRFAAWDLICAIEEDRQPVSNMYTARTAQEMIQGIYASSLSGRAIEFPLKNRRHPLR